MSDAWGFEDDDNEGQDNNDYQGPKPLRDAYRKQLEKNKALEERLAAIEAQSKQSQVQSIFGSLGVDPAVANSYSGEASPEAIKSWVDGMRAAFGGTASVTESAPTQGLSADTQNQYQRLTDAGSDGTPLSNAETVMASMKDAQSTDELLKIWKTIH